MKKIFSSLLLFVSVSLSSVEIQSQLSAISNQMYKQISGAYTQITNAYSTGQFPNQIILTNTNGFTKIDLYAQTANSKTYYLMRFKLDTSWGALNNTRFILRPIVADNNIFLGSEMYTDLDANVSPFYSFYPVDFGQTSYMVYNYGNSLSAIFVDTKFINFTITQDSDFVETNTFANF